MVVPELVAVWGPWTLQAAVLSCVVEQCNVAPRRPDKKELWHIAIPKRYAEVLYFLTGEHRYYNRKSAVFGRVTPNQNSQSFGMTEGEEECGIGAWQLGVRYSWIDLDNKGFRGSTCQDITIGLNWFSTHT